MKKMKRLMKFLGKMKILLKNKKKKIKKKKKDKKLI